MVAHAAGIIAHRRCGKSPFPAKFMWRVFSSYHTLTSSLTDLLSIEPPHFSAKHRAPMGEVKYDPRSAEIQLRQFPRPAFLCKTRETWGSGQLRLSNVTLCLRTARDIN